MDNSSDSQQPDLFNSYDYVLFSLILGISCLIGIWFGCVKKQVTRADYLFGGKQMTKLPVSLSLIAGQVSGITLLATPVDVYTFGAQYVITCISVLFIGICIYFIYAPVFYNLQISSAYEYLELRFNSNLRVIGSILYALSSLLYLPIVIYVPALAFAHVASVNVHWVSSVLCAVCVFYTTIGGLKTVVWTDALQIVMMFAAVVIVLGLGINSAGGFGEVWSKASDGGRLLFDFNLNPTKRDTVYTIFIGTFYTFHYFMAINQSYVQRYISLPTLKDVKWVIVNLAIGYSLFIAIAVLTGLAIYVKYADCDPLASGQISKQDQILAYYVMDVAKPVPGLAGLFFAGLFSGTLSTLSSFLNSLSGTIYEDLISPFVTKDISERAASNIMKLVGLILGILVLVFTLLVEQMGDVMPLFFAMNGIISGPLLGIFCLGMLFPRANSKGTIIGAITSTLTMSYIIIQAQVYQNAGYIKHAPKPISIAGCEHLANVTVGYVMSESTTIDTFEPFFIFRISHYYYTAFGFLLTIIISIVASLVFRNDNEVVSKGVIAPIMHWAMKRERTNNDYKCVETKTTKLECSYK